MTELKHGMEFAMSDLPYIPDELSMDDLHTIQGWLQQFDACPLECDGLSSVINTALRHQGYAVEIGIGSLSDGQRSLTHHWLMVSPSIYIDLRARMWFPKDGAHGIFNPAQQALDYRLDCGINREALPNGIFMILAGFPIEEVTTLNLTSSAPAVIGAE